MQDQASMGGEGGYDVPILSEELLAIDGYWERENHCVKMKFLLIRKAYKEAVMSDSGNSYSQY